jgi:LacI family transcriptional regulator
MPPTLVSIAKKLGVTAATVSYALRGTGGVSAQTRERVLRTAQQLGYRPNAAAQAVRRGRFNAVGLLASTRTSEGVMHPSALWALQEALHEQAYHLVASRIPDNQLTRSDVVPTVLQNWMVDGLLINYTHHEPQGFASLVDEARLPSVWLNAKRAKDAVYPDDVMAGEIATAQLLRSGHRRVAFLSFRDPVEFAHYSITDRRFGYSRAMTDAGLSTEVISLHGMSDGQRLESLISLLGRRDRPTGIVAYSDTESAAALYAAALARVSVPDDLSLIGIVDELRPINSVVISAVLVGHAAMARSAVDLLLTKLNDNPGDRPSIKVPAAYFAGATECPPVR